MVAETGAVAVAAVVAVAVAVAGPGQTSELLKPTPQTTPPTPGPTSQSIYACADLGIEQLSPVLNELRPGSETTMFYPWKGVVTKLCLPK